MAFSSTGLNENGLRKYLATVVRKRITERGALVSDLSNARIIAVTPTAIQRLAERVREGEGWRSMLKTFNGTQGNGAWAVDGFVDLQHSVYSRMLFDFDRALIQVQPQAEAKFTAQPAPHWRNLDAELPTEYGYVAKFGTGLLLRKPGAAAPRGFNGEVWLTTNHAPATITAVPDEHEDALITTIVAMLTGEPTPGLGEKAAHESAQGGRVK